MREDACSFCNPETSVQALHPKVDGQLLLSGMLVGHLEAPDNHSALGGEISHPFMMETTLAGLLEALILLVLRLELCYHHCYCHHSPIHKALS